MKRKHKHKHKTAIHVEPKRPTLHVAPEQLQILLRSPECDALVAALADTVRAILGAPMRRL